MIATSHDRVPAQTSDEINQQIRQAMEQRLAHYHHASKDAISARIEELEHEWDIERTLEANAATLACTGCVLTAFVNRRWVFLPMAVTAFLLQHALQGWCPPLPALRRMGFRTQQEIDEERYALKLLRGDFADFAKRNQPSSTEAIVNAIRR